MLRLIVTTLFLITLGECNKRSYNGLRGNDEERISYYNDSKTVERGQPNAKSYRVYFKNSNDEIVSPWHDIPLYADKAANILNAVVEMPRWVNAKFEISKKEKFNPLYQEVTSDNKLRYISNLFPYHSYIWNYCSLPQTWLDPNVNDEKLGLPGDNDLLDVVEIGSKVHARGSVVQVKVLGALGLIDGDEAEWKIIAINVNDPLAAKLNDINDVETNLIGLLDAIRDLFRIYKVPIGKPATTFAENGKAYDKSFALGVIQKKNKSWEDLIKGLYAANPEKHGNSLFHTSDIGVMSGRLSASEADKTVAKESQPYSKMLAPVDQVAIDTVSYVDRTKV